MKAFSFPQFLTTGHLGDIHLSVSKDFLEGLLGSPEDFSTDAKTDQGARIWKYGDVEFHFPDRIHLGLIHCDHGSCSLFHDAPWVIDKTTVGEVERWLAEQGIAYDGVYTQGGVRLMFEDGIYAGFSYC